MTGWLPVAYEQRSWLPQDGTLSKRRAAAETGAYNSSLLPEIAAIDVAMPSALQSRVEEATLEMSLFDAEASILLGQREFAPLSVVLLRSESAASSQIENLTVGARQIALSELGHEASRNAATVSANVGAMKAALALADDVSESSVLAMHSTLMARFPYAEPGRYRTGVVWIGGSGPRSAAFVPPFPSHLSAAMKDLVSFSRRRDIPALTHVALTHAQFETIHPFADGNGRTGRALAQSMLRAREVTRRVTVPVSAGLLHDVDRYFDALGAFRDGGVEPIVEVFVEAAGRAVMNGRQLVGELVGLRDEWASRIAARQGSSAWGALDVVIGQPVLDVRYLSTQLGVSIPTAQAAITTLENAGVLAQTVHGKKRNRVWHSAEVLDALDAFAERAGRRQGGFTHDERNADANT